MIVEGGSGSSGGGGGRAGRKEMGGLYTPSGDLYI